jgi:hypothetical protein
MCESPAVAEKSAAGAPDAEIEITEAMIAAGAALVEHFNREMDDPRETAREIFVDMCAARGSDSRR